MFEETVEIFLKLSMEILSCGVQSKIQRCPIISSRSVVPVVFPSVEARLDLKFLRADAAQAEKLSRITWSIESST